MESTPHAWGYWCVLDNSKVLWELTPHTWGILASEKVMSGQELTPHEWGIFVSHCLSKVSVELTPLAWGILNTQVWINPVCRFNPTYVGNIW